MNIPHLCPINSARLVILALWSCLFYSACSSHEGRFSEADKLNRKSFTFRYRNVDSTRIMAQKALVIADREGYDEGKAKALLNLAFCHVVRMEYDDADSLLDVADSVTDNDITRLEVAVQRMRLCQRRSQNKDFYFQKASADKLIEKIRSNRDNFSDMDLRRYTYGRSEYGIVLSTYLYYVQLYEESSEALLDVGNDPDMILISDTAQYIGYLYNIGAGGILRGLSDKELLIKEFNNLMMCYIIAHKAGYVYWEANALQSISEHISDAESLDIIRGCDAASLRYLNDDNVPDSLLFGNLAERALLGFEQYGDVYQIAGAKRTLSQCYRNMGDHYSELDYLLSAVEDSVVYQAPDLVASINEKLSLAYSAIDEKQMSDYFRNLYLDIQDSTRQDRQLEARVDELTFMLNKTRALIIAIILLLLFLSAVVYTLYRRRKRNANTSNLESIETKFNQWKDTYQKSMDEADEQIEELDEQINTLSIQKENALRVNVEQHAKISFVRNIMPLIDRMLHAAKSYRQSGDKEQLGYVSDVSSSILDYNASLTRWVQLRKGQITMRIETFALKDIFDIVALGKSSFTSKGINLNIEDNGIRVKADRALTLFIVNTLLDNARKYSREGGTVTLSASDSAQYADYVEISVKDEGEGMSQEKVDGLFDYKPIDNGTEDLTTQKSHGFGLMNCRGIITRYKKTSEFFAHCSIFARSEEGKGTTITFLLPKIVKMLILLLTIIPSLLASQAYAAPSRADKGKVLKREIVCDEAPRYADSVYSANVNGNYAYAIIYADSCLSAINRAYLSIPEVDKRDTLSFSSNGTEIRWKRSGIDYDYMLIAFLRNEIAVASLALHDWTMYEQNNKSYTGLYKECSKDTTLNTYCQTMERTEQQYNISVVVLVILFVVLLFLFWWFYVREVIHHRRSKVVLNDLVTAMNEGDDMATLKSTMERSLALLSNENIEALSSKVRPFATTMRDELSQAYASLTEAVSSIHSKTESIGVLQRERDKIVVSNNVIDNTLSALKHETMYFPSRISTLVENGSSEELLDVIEYYRALYAMLSAQCARNEQDIVYSVRRMPLSALGFDFSSCDEEQLTKVSIIANKQLMDYLALIIKRKNNREKPQAQWGRVDDRYISLTVSCPNLLLSDEQLSQAFSPSSPDVDMLILRQILRETGSATNSYASGIRLVKQDDILAFVITLPAVS
ncbi:MAG: DUF5112 domain-containing protein [Prevotella sp.]|nr:DUF5112 domain-containing protein [Prevotella sp.]